MRNRTRRIAFAGVLAAVYAAVTIATASLAYGPVQFRLAEALTVLCCFTPAAVPGMVVGCMAANLASYVSAWDFAIGSFATLLASLLTWAMWRKAMAAELPCAGAEPPEPRSGMSSKSGKSVSARRLLLVLLTPLPTILCNAVIVGGEIAIFFDDRAFLPAWGLNALSVGAGEAAVLYLLGVPLLVFLLKNRELSRRLRRI